MTQNELIDLYHSIEETLEERRKLGEFDANSKYMITLLEGLLSAVEAVIVLNKRVSKLEREKKK